MNDQIKAGADIHAGDGGYSEGTKEGYEAFVKLRKDNIIKSLAQEAGFCYYTPEEDPLEPIDWSCDYEQEFKDFAIALQKQTRDETVQQIVSLLKELHEISKGRHNLYLCTANLIEEDFKDT
jgi:hypothetical protein